MIDEDTRRRVDDWHGDDIRDARHRPLHVDALAWATSLFGDRVTEREGFALALRIEKRWSYRIIGGVLNVSGGRAQQLVRRAKRKLRRAMDRNYAAIELRRGLAEMKPHASAMPAYLDMLFGRRS